MIVPDIIFRDRTCLVFCFLGCVVKFQAREANSWRRKKTTVSVYFGNESWMIYQVFVYQLCLNFNLVCCVSILALL